MSESMESKVNQLIEELMRIADAPRYCKLCVRGERIEIQPWSLLQPLWRTIAGETVDDTRKRLQQLYSDAFFTLDLIMSLVDLNIVLLPSKSELSDLENKRYLMHKQWLDSLTHWISESVKGLNHLNERYDKKETIFPMLATASERKVAAVRERSDMLDRSYKKLKLLPPLSAAEYKQQDMSMASIPPPPPAPVSAESPMSASGSSLSPQV